LIQDLAKLRVMAHIQPWMTSIFPNRECYRMAKTSLRTLNDHRPIDAMAEDGGLDLILHVIGRIPWGIPS